jgi:Protein of unknown function (DUF2948)
MVIAMAELKLIALDADDLVVISAQLQDAVLRVGDIAYLPRERRLALVGNRFDWVAAFKQVEGEPEYIRRQTALRFERVLDAKLQGIALAQKNAVLSLLAIAFEPDGAPESPGGHVTLNFADGAMIRLHVECIEAELKDMGAAWSVDSMPRHPDDNLVPASA